MHRKSLRTSSIFTLLSLGASALNFLYYPLISHLLPTSQFGDVQVGVSFIMVIAGLFSSLNVLAIFYRAEHQGKNHAILHLEHLIISISIVAAIVVCALAQPISAALHLQDASLLYILAATFIINIPATTWLGVLQGSGKFAESGGIAIASSLIKIIVSFGAIYLGLGAHGALIGIWFGTFTILPLAALTLKGELSLMRTFTLLSRYDLHYFRQNHLVLLSLVALALFAAIATVDVMAAKLLLGANEAGEYARLSTAAKIPYFFTVPVSLVLFERYASHSLAIKKSLTLYALLATLATLTTILFGDIILRLMFNHTGSLTYTVFPVLTASFGLLSIATLISYICIIKGKAAYLLYAATASLVIVVTLLLILPPAPQTIAISYFTALLILLLSLCALLYTKSYEK